MSRTIAELTAGQTVYLDETVNGTVEHVPYFYLGQDESGNCIILRQYAAVQKRMHSTNEAVYDGCEADIWLENEETGFLSRFDTATKMALVSTQIKCNNIATGEIAILARRCFLLSYTEEGYATTPDEGPSYLAALQTATGLTGNSAHITYNQALTTVVAWLRSAASVSQFRCVNAYGYAFSSIASDSSRWLRPALSVAPATIVSSETEDTIYLLPDAEKTYREIDATILLGSSILRPKQAKIALEATNCTMLQLEISNNARDANPVWVSIENGGIAELTNQAKESENWELGVRVYAQSGGKAVVSEPVVIIATD